MGLPGLVLWAEDYFNTISAEKIYYSENDGTFNKKFEKQLLEFNNNKGDDQIEDKIFLLKKQELNDQFMSQK